MINELQTESVDLTPALEVVSRKAKELKAAALEVEQLSLQVEVEFEEEMLLATDEIKKRYTGTNDRRGVDMVARKELCLRLLAYECPVQDIARLLKMNKRTIASLASQDGRRAGAFSEQYANQLMANGSALFALAETKKHDAKFIELVTAGAIQTDKAIAIKMMGGGDLNAAIDAEQVDEKLVAARKFLEMKAVKSDGLNREPLMEVKS